MRFLSDMGISYVVGDWLNKNGHDAIHISLEGLHRLADTAIIEKAILEQRIILTADMDFGHILAFNKNLFVSVIQFRLVDLGPEIIIPNMEIILNKFSSELESTHAIVTVQEHKIRLKTLPL